MIDRKITVTLEPREDGGIRIWSDDVPGLILSGPDQLKIMSDIGPALTAILEYKRQVQTLNRETGKNGETL